MSSARKRKEDDFVRRPPTGTRVRLTVNDRRRQLIELGLRAFTARPYDEVSIDAIAAEAGISRGLLFHYFATKRGYYVACLEIAAEELVRETFSLETGTPLERLLAGLEAYFRYVGEHASAYATLLRAGVGADPVVRGLVDATRARIIDRIRADLEPLLPAETDPRQIRAGLRGWIGLVEALALDWVDRAELAAPELVSLCMRALVAALPPGGDAALFASPPMLGEEPDAGVVTPAANETPK
jgi:AcrR family transcriptional regulator